jgi:DNA-directed RNA polymerase specialized sigma subunit
MAKLKYYESKTWLARKYQWEKKTAAEIAAICGVTEMTISRWLHKHQLVIPSKRK